MVAFCIFKDIHDICFGLEIEKKIVSPYINYSKRKQDFSREYIYSAFPEYCHIYNLIAYISEPLLHLVEKTTVDN